MGGVRVEARCSVVAIWAVLGLGLGGTVKVIEGGWGYQWPLGPPGGRLEEFGRCG